MLNVTAAIIQNAEGAYLICRRSSGGSCANLWEFPGGKLEPGETLEQCLVRECREELGISIAIDRFFLETTYRYPERELRLVFYLAKILNGRPRALVHREVKWVYPLQLLEYAFCPADTQVIRALLEQ